MPREKKETREGLNVVEINPGVGSTSIALKELGIPIKSKDVVESNGQKTRMYNRIHGEEHEPMSISEYRLPEDRQIDIMSFGSPMKGFSGPVRESEISDIWQIARMVIELPYEQRPKNIIFDSEDGMISKMNKPEFKKFSGFMDTLGYDTLTMPLRGKDFGGVEENSRVFTLLAKRDEGTSFDFDNLERNESKKYNDILEKHTDVDDRFFLKPSSNFIDRAQREGMGVGEKDTFVKHGIVSVDDGQLRPDKNRMDKHGQKQSARFLTPRENFRRKGVGDESFDRLLLNGDKDLDELIEGSANVDTLKAIFKELF